MATNTQIKDAKQKAEAIGYTVMRTELCSINRPFSEEQKDELTHDLVNLTHEEARLEEAKKDSAKAFSDKLKKNQSEREALANQIGKGFAEIEDRCVIALDPSTNEVVIIDPVTSIEVSRKKAKVEDLQTDAFQNDDEQTAQDATTSAETPQAPPAALELGYDGGKGEKGAVDLGNGPVEIDAEITDNELLAEAPKELDTHVDMVKSVELADHGWFIETMERTFYTDNAEVAEVAEEAAEQRCYVEIDFNENAQARNQMALAIRKRETAQEPEIDIVLPEGVEDGTADLE